MYLPVNYGDEVDATGNKRCFLQGSAHFKNEERKQTQTDARIAQIKAQAVKLTAAELAGYRK
jgi:hypothetical protein